ncbi:tyramine/octopamine receptor-like [Clytia hemisphaerica]
MYAFCIHFIVYWVFIQPFIGKDFEENEAVSYTIGASVIVCVAFISNIYLIAALLFGTDGDPERSPVYFFFINIALADLIQACVVFPLNMYEKIAFLSIDFDKMDDLSRVIKLVREFEFLSGILNGASLAMLCFASMIRTWDNLPRCTNRSVTLFIQLAWLYTVICFTYDAVYWLDSTSVWSTQHSATYSSTVEFFVPLTISLFSIIVAFIIEHRRAPENLIMEKDVKQKVLVSLTLLFIIFRAPSCVLNLVKQGKTNNSFNIKKITRIVLNLYSLKCCINPILLHFIHKPVRTMYTNLNGKLRIRFGMCFNRLGTKTKEGVEGYVNFDACDQNVNIIEVREEEENSELLP